MTTRASNKTQAGRWAGSTSRSSKATVKVRKTRTGKTTATASKTLKQAIQKVIRGDSETKYRAEPLRNLSTGNTLATYTAFSSGITGVAEIYAALPRVSQGVDEHERIGDVISPTSCTVHLDITSPSFGQNDAKDKTVHVFLLQCTSVKDLNNYSAVPMTSLLDNGNGGNVGFDGTSQHAMYPINRKNFTVLKHKKFRLVKGFGKPNGSSATDPAGLTDSTISPAASYRHIAMRVKLPKKLKYSAHGSTYPANAAPFVVIGWTNNWAVDAASNVIDLQVIGRVEMRYKDE